MEKDYSLLRPFDLEAAKRGENICFHDEETCEFVAEGKFSSGHCFRMNDGQLYLSSGSLHRMKPLAWVEGKPVYRGDVLYRNLTHKTQKVVVEERFKSGDIEYLRFENGEGTEYADNRENCMTWQKPKTKREGWVNVYTTDRELGCRVYGPFANKESAIASAADDLIDTVPISWEE